MKQVILKRRALPAPGHMRVQIGDMVQHDTVIAELDYVPGLMQRVDAAGLLGIHPQLLGEKMRLGIGEPVRKGDTLAENLEFCCLKEVLSPIDGSVALWSKYLGFIYLRNASQQAGENKPIVFRASDFELSNKEFIADFLPLLAKKKEISGNGESMSPLSANLIGISSTDALFASSVIVMAGQRLFRSSEQVAPFTCRVTVISEGEGRIEMMPLFQINQLQAHLSGLVHAFPEVGVCLIATYGHRFQGSVGYGDERSGVLQPLLAEDRELSESDIQGDLLGCIVVARGGASLAALRKLASLQVAGLVLGSLEIDILAEFSEQEPLQHIGHQMALPFPIVLLQGYEGAMAETTYSEIATLKGRNALIDASTQMRAGVARPELLVPLGEEIEERSQSLLNAGITQDEKVILRAGDRVFITRSPYAGQQALLVSVGSRLEETPSGTRTVLAEVRLLDTDESLLLPFANCRKIV